MAQVVFDSASRQYQGTSEPAVKALDLTIAAGEFVVLVGTSGSGKSTALRMLAGLEPTDAGHIYIADRDVTKVHPRDRDIAMVFQNYALYPHMSAADNVSFNLRIRRRPRQEVTTRLQDTAQLLGITEYLARKPGQLSGGQRQRVAMGRAIIRHPAVFLMDEPLSNLDAQLRVQMRAQIAALQGQLGVTTIYVTHDQVEAMTMGDRVAVLRDGALLQCASPRELFQKPTNAFVASFIGSPSMNVLDVPVDDRGAHLGDVVIPISSDIRRRLNGDRILIGIRPDALSVRAVGDGLSARVEVVEDLGMDAYIYASIEPAYSTGQTDALRKPLVVRAEAGKVPPRGAVIGLGVSHDAVHYFDPFTESRL